MTLLTSYLLRDWLIIITMTFLPSYLLSDWLDIIKKTFLTTYCWGIKMTCVAPTCWMSVWPLQTVRGWPPEPCWWSYPHRKMLSWSAVHSPRWYRLPLAHSHYCWLLLAHSPHCRCLLLVPCFSRDEWSKLSFWGKLIITKGHCFENI